MKNIGLWCAIAAVGVLMGREFRDWVWWYLWEDEEDEPNPAPFLGTTWAAWQLIERTRFWLWAKVRRPLERTLASIWKHSRLPELPPEPTDKDGRTLSEWLAIDVVGIWNLESWYKDEYDWEVKRKWDECLKSRQAGEDSEAEGRAAPKSGD